MSRAVVRALVAERSLSEQMTVARVLQELGWQCDMVSTGAQALEAATQHSYDVVLVDCDTSDLDGIEMARVMRQDESANGEPAIIGMRTPGLAGNAEHCMAAGMDGTVSKPLSSPALREAINHHLAPSALGVEADRPPVAVEILGRSAHGDPELAYVFTDMLLAELDEHMMLLEGAVQADADERVRATAHQLEERCTRVGAWRLERRAVELEVLGTSIGQPWALKKLEEVKEEFERVNVYLTEFRRQEGAESLVGSKNEHHTRPRARTWHNPV